MQGLINLFILGTILFVGFALYQYVQDIWNRKRAREREKKYWSITEPKYRKHNTYPPDWQIRRAFVFYRENGLCEKCKKISGSINVEKVNFWLNPHVNNSYSVFVRSSHVHHIKHISSGGDHALSNLQLLCEDCHDKEHPNMSIKKSLQRARAINNLYFNYESKVKTARKTWICNICKESILPKSKYFGGSYSKICMECYKKYNKSISKQIG